MVGLTLAGAAAIPLGKMAILPETAGRP